MKFKTTSSLSAASGKVMARKLKTKASAYTPVVINQVNFFILKEE